MPARLPSGLTRVKFGADHEGRLPVSLVFGEAVALKVEDVGELAQAGVFHGGGDVLVEAFAEADVEHERLIRAEVIAQERGELEEAGIALEEVVVDRELEGERRAGALEPGDEALGVAGEADAVGDHDEASAARMLGEGDEIPEARVDGGLAALELELEGTGGRELGAEDLRVEEGLAGRRGAGRAPGAGPVAVVGDRHVEPMGSPLGGPVEGGATGEGRVLRLPLHRSLV